MVRICTRAELSRTGRHRGQPSIKIKGYLGFPLGRQRQRGQVVVPPHEMLRWPRNAKALTLPTSDGVKVPWDVTHVGQVEDKRV